MPAPVHFFSVVASVCMYTCCPHPPEVFPVGLFGDIVFGVDVSLQGAKAGPLRNVFFAEHARHLENKATTSRDVLSFIMVCMYTHDICI